MRDWIVERLVKAERVILDCLIDLRLKSIAANYDQSDTEGLRAQRGKIG